MEPADLIPLNPRDYLILFCLASGERHGYGIVKQVAADSRGQVRVDPANLYRAIRRLMRTGVVVESERRVAADAGNRRRRYYAITEFGRRVVTLEAERLARLADAARAENLIPGSAPRG